MRTITKCWIALGLLALLSPLGLILPAHFKAGKAWGEWGAEDLQQLVGYAPQGLQKFGARWQAPLPDYAFPGWGGKGLTHLGFAYIVSAVVGIGAVVALAWLLGKALAKKDD